MTNREKHIEDLEEATGDIQDLDITKISSKVDKLIKNNIRQKNKFKFLKKE